jgi:Bacterial extracellular solute-binding proteins, family 5 Middle
MSEKTKLEEIQAKSRKVSASFGALWSHIYPLDRKVFTAPRSTILAIGSATKLAQSLIALSVIGIIISLVLISTGIYYGLTKEVPKNGGNFTEVVLSSNLEMFNPALDLTSPGEQKISSLLFHPLYKVEYPNFMENPNQKPTITPILLTKQPEWIDATSPDPAARYKTLQFTLRNDLQWSDKTPITVDDVEYTFGRLQEAKGNSRFRNTLKNISFKKLSEFEFQFFSEIPNPQLQYTAGFSPISKNYYANQNTDRLATDEKSKRISVTSGWYHLSPNDIQNPTNQKQTISPITINPGNGGLASKVVLSKNLVTNLSNSPLIENYTVQKVDNIFNVLEDQSAVTLENLSSKSEADLFTRDLGTNLGVTSQQLTNKVSLDSKTVPTNTFYTLFLNIRKGDYFVNQNMRKYVMCHLLQFQSNPAYDNNLISVPREKRLAPIQLNTPSTPDCGTNLDDILLSDPARPYTIGKNEKNEKQVYVFGTTPKLKMIGLAESDPLLSDVVNYFRNEIGLGFEIVRDNNAVQQSLTSKEYNAAFLPITYASQDLTPIFGESGRDISEIRRNRDVNPAAFEENLAKYSLSDYSDQTAKQGLVDFFSSQYISLNMFQSLHEYNYNERINKLSETLPGLHVFPEDIYKNIPDWYTQTERRFN